MLPIILALAGGYLIIDSQKEKLKFEDGGEMADGGKMAKGGISTSDDRWEVTFQNQDNAEFETITVRANNKKNAIAIAEDESGLSSDWQYYSAEKEMADGGMMAKGGEFEEGDYVFVKPEKLNGEVIRITGENVVVEFTNRRPQSGDKRRNYKIKDLRKMAKGGKMAMGGSVKEEIEIKGHTIKHIKNSYDDYWYFVYQSTPFEFETKEEAVKSLNGLIKTNPYADGGEMAKGGEVDKELIDSSAKEIYEQKGMMGLRNTFLQVAKTDEEAGDKKTAEYRRKVVSEYQSKQPKFMAKGGKMAKGGELPSSFKKRLDNAKKTYGVTITKEQAEKAFKMHNDKGMGGSTVGYELFNPKSKRGSQTLGDLAIDLGRHYSK